MGNADVKSGSGIELDLIELPDLPELDDDDAAADKNLYKQLEFSNILEDLDKKMKSGKFLHTFTAQVEEINRVIRMKYSSTRDIASVILKDVALSSKVLSIVNSCYYGQFSQKGISSIPEAMVILGTEEVQQAAATLLLFEFMRDISKSEVLKEKSLESLMRGIMAKEIACDANYKSTDEFQLVAMLYDIGEQIILFCEPDAYNRIRKISEQSMMDMDSVSKQIIGASFSSIGSGIASGWGFPQSVVECIKPFKEFNMHPESLTAQSLKRLVASFTKELANLDWRMSESIRKKKLEDIIRRYGHFLDIGMADADGLLSSSLEKVQNHAKVLKITLKNSKFDKNAVPSSSDLHVASAENLWKSSQIVPEGMADGIRQISENNIIWIENHIKKIEDALTSNFRLSEILHRIITTIYKGFFFSKIAICIMNRATGIMGVRCVLGDEADRFGREFQFKISDSDDAFNKSLSTGLDIVIEDINAKFLNSRIPDWYINGNFAKAFAVYPIVVEQKKVGLIYVDWEKNKSHLFSAQVKHLMQRIKNLTVTAIKKSKT
ncbi:MAG: HDOD domain-containing protein [Desulfamplus sp.]